MEASYLSKKPRLSEPSQDSLSSSQIASQKVDETTFHKNEDNVRCQFYLPAKQRSCTQVPIKGTSYCSVHNTNAKDKRVSCPLDPRHTVLEKHLEKHMNKLCPMIQMRKEQESWKYFKRDINLDKTEDSKEVPSKNSHFPSSHLKKMKQPSFVQLVSEDQLSNLIAKIDLAFDKFVPSIPMLVLKHKSCEEQFLTSTSMFKTKHVIQEASIIGHMEMLDLLNPNNVYIELGAGKGRLSHVLQTATGAKCILVDRLQGLKNKKDGMHHEDPKGFQRISIDIKDLYLAGIEDLNGKNVVAFSKHLCGAAADLAVRCVHNTLPGELKTCALIIANCCHHRCVWNIYSNKQFILEDVNLSPEEFRLLCGLTSWATDGKKHDTTNVQQNDEIISHKDIPVSRRKEIGYKCKRLLDIGRLKLLQKKRISNFHGSLCR